MATTDPTNNVGIAGTFFQANNKRNNTGTKVIGEIKILRLMCLS